MNIRSGLSRVVAMALVAAAGFAVYACSESTAPSNEQAGPERAVISVRVALPGGATARSLQLSTAHVVLRRSDGTEAFDQTVAIGSNLTALEFLAEVLVDGADGEQFSVSVELFGTSGGALFRSVNAVVRGDPDLSVSPVNVTIQYVGPGAQATRVEVMPAQVTAAPGTTIDLTARALTAAGAEEPSALVFWTSLDPSIATVANPSVGRVALGVNRGTARIRASLPSGPSAEATINVLPPPAAIAVQSGDGQGGTPGNALAFPLVARVTATDGLGIGGVTVSFAIQSGAGTLAANSAVTGNDGLASVGFTFGAEAGPVVIAASAEGLAGSPALFTVTSAASAAAQLVFVAQPSEVVAGVVMSPVIVEARDEAGNLATGFSGTVTVSLESAGSSAQAAVRASQTAGVQLLGTVTVNAVGGIATFADLRVSGPAASIRLRATAVGIASAASSFAFTAVAGTATGLVFASQPTNVVASNSLPTLLVHAQDALANLVTSYDGLVTLSLLGAPPGVMLQGASAVQAVGGIATFIGLSVSGPALSVQLTAAGAGIAGTATSSTFGVSPASAIVTATPTSVTFNVQRTAPSPAPANVQLTASSAVSNLTVGTITYGAGASGWLAASLAATSTPTTLTLTATTPTLSVGTFSASVPITGSNGVSILYSASVVITPLPASQIAIVTQPAGAASGSAFATQPVLELRDATGTRVLTATNAVTVDKASGPGTLAGTMARNAVQGRVTFTDLRITGTGAHTLGFSAAGLTGATSASFTVNPALSTTQAVASTTGTVGTPIASFTPVTATGGVTPYAFALSGGSLPSGMSFNTGSGQVSGTPTTALATRTYTVTVTDAAGSTSSKTFQLTVNGPLSTAQAVPSKAGTVNVAIAAFVPVTAAGGTAPYTYALSGGSLPAGMSFSTSTGEVSGTPTAVFGPTTLTVTVTDAAASNSSKTFSLTVNPALNTTQVVPTTVGTAGAGLPSFTPVTASSGTAPYTFALTGGSLPSGMSFNTSSGLVSGGPTTALATTTFTVTATDAAGATSSKTFQLTVNPPLVTTQAVGAVIGTINVALGAFTPVTISGGTPPYTRALGGSLPSGVSFNTGTGQVSGTPTVTLATTTYTVFVTDAVGAASNKTFQLTITPPLTTTQAVASRTGTVGTAIAAFTPVTASGGSPPYGFALSGGTLPTGMSFSTTTGEIVGTPTATLGATVFTVTVTDGTGSTSAKTFTLTVNPALATVQAVPSTTGTVNVAIPAFTPVTASGGTTPYVFSLSASLPSGMSFNTTNGEVSGTPTSTLGATSFTVTVTDAAGAQSSKTFELTVNGALSTTQAVPNTSGVVNQVLATFTPVTASGGTLPYSFALSGGTLPNGLSFNTSTGAISGTPTETLATTQFTVTVTDGVAATSAKTFNLTIQPAAPTGIVLNVSGSSSATITQGQQLAIPIELDLSNAGSDNLASITVTISWDPTRFSFTSQSAGNWPDASVTANTTQTASGILSITGFAAEGATSSFTLRNLTLTALTSGAATTVDASVSTAANELGGAVTVTARNLTVTINP